MRVLITGGLGLIGCSYAKYCLTRGDDVFILDNYSKGQASYRNAEWLLQEENRPVIKKGSTANYMDLASLIGSSGGFDAVVHAAAQTSSSVALSEPMKDFEWNAVGTFNLLEVLRCECPTARVVNLTSRKIYATREWAVQIESERLRWVSQRIGPSEVFPLNVDAHEFYSASRLAGLFYTRCFAMNGMPIVTLVLSDVYGRHQYGSSLQGWVSWMAIATELGLPITVYGDGTQSRDLLHVSDVVSAIDIVLNIAQNNKGAIFNAGGGPANVMSVRGVLELIKDIGRKDPVVQYAEERPYDVKTYVTNYERLLNVGWHPSMGVLQGISDLMDWVKTERPILKTLYKVR